LKCVLATEIIITGSAVCQGTSPDDKLLTGNYATNCSLLSW